MIPMRKTVLFICFALPVLFGCSSDIADSGSGTQTTNGICVVSHDGSISGYVFAVDPADSSREIPAEVKPVSLQLFSSVYRPYDGAGFSVIPVQDGTGSFTCDSLERGLYNLFAYDSLKSGAALIQEIPINDSTGQFTVRAFFAPWVTVQGVIHDTSAMQADFRGAYITGTPFFAVADSIGAFSFPRVPAGDYTIKADYFIASQGTRYLRAKGFIVPDDTLVVYTDSIEVNIRFDSLVHRVELSL